MSNTPDSRTAAEPTDLNRLQDELAHQRVLSNASFEAIFLSEKGVCLEQNRTARLMFGYTDEEAVGRMGTEWIAPRDRDLVMHNMINGVEEPYEALALRKDGSTFPCEIRGRMLKFRDRDVRVTALLDISVRKKAELALLESEERNRALLAAIPDIIFVLSRDGVFLDYQCPSDRHLIAPPEEFIGRNTMDIMDEPIARETMRVIAQVLGTRETGHQVYSYEHEGVTRYMEARAAPCGDDQVLFIVRDETETVKLRQQESRAQRLELAGQIAGHVAHDFNNLLGPMVAYPDFIRGELPADHSALEYVRCIEDAGSRMAEMNQQLLTLSRRGHYNLNVLDLDEIVAKSVSGLRAIPETIVVETDLGGSLPIKGGKAQIHRVLANLLSNALDAVDGVGRVVVTTRNVYLDHKCVGFDRIPRGEYVRLTVADDGCGMSPNEVEKIFDPFHTTKTVTRKRGSGLGLNVVKSVLEDHGGYIDVETAPGTGTSMHVLIPITREHEEAPAASSEPGCGETVLVVDDDALQRRISVDLLTRLGYAAKAVGSGEEAVAHLAEQAVDLVLLDMIMPGRVDGAETYRRILEVAPGQKAIVVSGHAESERVAEAQRLGAGDFVRKPLTLDTLAAAVKKGLGERA